MDPPQQRPAAQRKRSYSTTAYTSLEEDRASPLFTGIHGSSSQPQSIQPACLLATAVGTQVLTYEFIDNGTVAPFIPAATSGPAAGASTTPKQPPPIAPGQFDGIQMSNERTAFTMASVKWSPDNSMLAVESHDGRVYLHDDRGKFQEVLMKEPVTETARAGNYRSALTWAPKHNRLYFAHGQKVMTWDSATGRTVETFEMASRINALAMKTDDGLLAIGQNAGTLDVVNRTTGTSGRLDTPASFIVSKLEFSIFSKSILGGIGNDGVLRLWDTGSTGSTAVYHSFEQKHELPINSMTFSPFNRFLICTVGLDKRYTLYDVDQRSVVKTRSVDHALTSVTFKNDGFSMAFGTDQGKVLLYDLRSTNRPISIVDTNINAPVTSIHFQGRRSSSLRRYQTLNGSTLKRQNFAGSKPSLFSPEPLSSASTTPMARSHTLGDTPTLPITKTLFSRPAPIKTAATGSNPNLNHLSGSGIFKSLRETQSAGAGGKGIMDLFSARRTTDKDSPTSAGQERISPKVRRPTAPATMSTIRSIHSDDLEAFQPSAPPMASLEGGGTSASGFISMPTTPGRDNAHPTSASYPNSRTVSPFAFQNRQSRSPSGESSSSSSSVNTPPGSPGAHGHPSSSEHTTNPLKHHHYSSADSLSKSPSRRSRAKRRKSLGTLLASGGASSIPGTPDPLSEEKMEILRGQIVDKVRNVLLNQPVEPTVSIQGRSQSGGSAGRSWPTSTAGTGSESTPVVPPEATKPAAAPFRDLWMQVGLNGGGSGVGVSSNVSKTDGTLSNPTTSISASSLGLPSLPSSSTLAMSLDPQESGSSFQSKILESVIDGCLMEFRAGIRNDIQNMHLELLRQFQIQKMEIEGLLKKYTDTRELQEENQRLLEENQRLRMNY
ncbi:Protein nedd1 [Mortierella sp. NVP41]|nr:Protein nedd1 [Mortierella sp. NVP41]